MSEDQFSFRWGIPWLDREYVQIPTVFFRHYMMCGITRSEFLFILHLASYKFESARGQSRPSLGKIAEQMGTTTRSVRRMRRSLEEKGLLQVHYQSGMPSIYSFAGLAYHLTDGKTTPDISDTPDTHVLPPRTPTSGVPRTPTSSEEQEDKKKNQQQEGDAVVSLSAAQEKAGAALQAVGVKDHAIRGILQQYGTARIMEVVGAVTDAEDIRNAGAWVVRCLERGYDLGVTEAGAEYERRLRATLGACAYRRNPQIGVCPGEDRERVPWAHCKVCDRGGKETALVEKQQEILF